MKPRIKKILRSTFNSSKQGLVRFGWWLPVEEEAAPECQQGYLDVQPYARDWLPEKVGQGEVFIDGEIAPKCLCCKG